MSELALDGPNKDEVLFTIWLQQLSPIPALLVARAGEISTGKRARKACAFNSWMKAGGSGVEADRM